MTTVDELKKILVQSAHDPVTAKSLQDDFMPVTNQASNAIEATSSL